MSRAAPTRPIEPAQPTGQEVHTPEALEAAQPIEAQEAPMQVQGVEVEANDPSASLSCVNTHHTVTPTCT